MRPGRIVARIAIACLSLLALLLTGLAFMPSAVLVRLSAWMPGQPSAATPPPPTLLAPRGELPAGAAGLQAWALSGGAAEQLAGSGFLLRLADGRVVGVTTAHGLALDDPGRALERVAFAVAGQPGYVAEFDRLHGPPGQARTGADMTVDYVLLEAAGPIASDLALAPDPRGAPQAGERVTLFSGLGQADGGPGTLAGTVLSVEPQAVWVLMDEMFDPGLMSGSPLLSQHTGQIVGMAIAAGPRGGRLAIGFHPIGSIVARAEAAAEFPALAGYRP
jgi:hypothetical protein